MQSPTDVCFSGLFIPCINYNTGNIEFMDYEFVHDNIDLSDYEDDI